MCVEVVALRKDALRDVVDVSAVVPAAAHVVKLDGAPGTQGVRELEAGHIGPAHGAVDRGGRGEGKAPQGVEEDEGKASVDTRVPWHQK